MVHVVLYFLAQYNNVTIASTQNLSVLFTADLMFNYLVFVCVYVSECIRATLESYAKMIRGQGRSQYAPVYPIMTQLLKIGFGQL